MSGIYRRSEGGALRQGEIVTNLTQLRLSIESIDNDSPEADLEIHPFAIILSQDCDLEQDWKAWQQSQDELRRQLPSVLLAQMNTAEELKGRVGGSDIWKRVIRNKDERYHFLEAVSQQDDALDDGLPELGIDFKRYFTIPTDELYKRLEKDARRRTRLQSPYLEHLSTRFCYYQSRVALPADHKST